MQSQIEHGCKSVVDVRDVAAAHIAAFERETVWEQRVLLVGGNPHWAEIAGYIHHALPPALKDNVRESHHITDQLNVEHGVS